MMQQAVNNLKEIYYLAVTPDGQGVPEYEFWFVFESCCLYCGCNRELACVPAPSAGAKVIPTPALAPRTSTRRARVSCQG